MPKGQWEPPDAGDAPAEIKRILRTVYAAYRDEHPAENPDVKAKGAQIAWGAVKRAGWHKDKDGKWVKEVSNLSPVNNEGSFSNQSLHDITLQRLDTSLPYNGGRLKYAIDNFIGTEQAWNSTLAVFVPPGVPVQHVDHVAFARDPHGEARRLGFRIVGHHSETKVIDNGPGEPRATTKAIFTDPEVDGYASAGKLSLSTGFDANITNGVMSGKVVPNHVLYFLRNENTAFGTPATANDGGAMVNNLSGDKMTDEKVEGMFSKILEHVTPKENPLKSTVDNLTSEIGKRDAQIAALTQEVAALKESKTALDNLMADQAKAAAETRWQEVKNLHQPGLFHKEKESVERAAFEKDNAGWLMAHIGNLTTVKPAPAKGKEAVGNLAGDEDKPYDIVEARGKLNAKTGVFE